MLHYHGRITVIAADRALLSVEIQDRVGYVVVDHQLEVDAELTASWDPFSLGYARLADLLELVLHLNNALRRDHYLGRFIPEPL